MILRATILLICILLRFGNISVLILVMTKLLRALALPSACKLSDPSLSTCLSSHQTPAALPPSAPVTETPAAAPATPSAPATETPSPTTPSAPATAATPSSSSNVLITSPAPAPTPTKASASSLFPISTGSLLICFLGAIFFGF
ncbi:hypothetical protein RIF29_41639 [Crotalaria pallida]|uniref:Uncharacterized protein n=1 Tax=Crotalaria pallida TaxID=3830 RepID=A0AAN9E5F8_CROPI